MGGHLMSIRTDDRGSGPQRTDAAITTAKTTQVTQ